jgi:hypothetical protein
MRCSRPLAPALAARRCCVPARAQIPWHRASMASQGGATRQGLCSHNRGACSFRHLPAQHLLAQGRRCPRQRCASAGSATPAAQADAVQRAACDSRQCHRPGFGKHAGPAPRRAGGGAPSSQCARQPHGSRRRAPHLTGCLARAQLPRVRPERGLAQRARAAARRAGRAGAPAHAPRRAPPPGARSPHPRTSAAKHRSRALLHLGWHPANAWRPCARVAALGGVPGGAAAPHAAAASRQGPCGSAPWRARGARARR